MVGKLHVEIVTPTGVVYEGDVDSLVAPARDGYLGVLPRHAPLIAELKPGDLRLRQGEAWSSFAVSGGILHVAHGRAAIMGDSAEPAGAIDVDRAQDALKRAQERLQKAHYEAGIDVRRAESALLRAVNRLRVAQTSAVDS
jgi:F-type H+-transporting ATPase subunit epsilon